MSKREGTPKVSENIPEQKKPKLNEGDSDNKGQDEAAAPQERPKSPIPGPSTAPSDPQLQASVQTGLIPIYRYFDPRVLQESSSQGSTSIEFGITSSSASASNTTSSTNAGTSDSGMGSGQPMDVDSETTTATTSSSSSSTNTEQRRKRRHRKHKSRRDQ